MHKKVAIIGYSFRLPGSDRENIWQNLCAGSNLITEVHPSRWEKDSFYHPSKGHPGSSYTFAAGSIGDVAGFDAVFFGISPREAACMDPQQRLLLELSWEAMEYAGVPPCSLRGSRCGVFVGVSSTDYASRFAHDLAAVDATTATGTTSSLVANRISYLFDLHGPSMAIDTACSSSLVAFHQACQAITNGDTDYALAGGVSLHLHPYVFLIFAQASMLSPRGRCNPFDASADGYVRSEGGGIFLLKEYEQAVADGDQILAVVAGSGVNTDGRKAGLTIPSARFQAELIEQVCHQAGITADAIDYFEAHGTGTPVGDPIEARALGEALGKKRASDNPLPIGSIKSNLGHLESAAGVAGLVKALLSLHYRMVPATIGVTDLNPAIDFKGLNLEVVTCNKPLNNKGPLHIGINSFGFGGANAHVILQGGGTSQHPADTEVQTLLAPLPVVISARDPDALLTAVRTTAAVLESTHEQQFYDIAYSLLYRRDLHTNRVVVYGTDLRTVAQQLIAFVENTAGPTDVEQGTALAHPSGPVFVYAGNGAQWEGMGATLLQDAVFYKAVEDVDHYFRPSAGFSLLDELAGNNGTGRYEYTEIAQPALFAIQVGITCMMRSLGIAPVAVVGHSVGEIAAAWACGALTLPDAVKVIYQRSRLQGLTKGLGKMTAVSTGCNKAGLLLQESGLTSLVLAGCNSSNGVTIAGTAVELEQFEALLQEQSISFRRLDLDYAFHSPAMDGIKAELLQVLDDLKPGKAMVPFYSTVAGGLFEGDSLDAGYWWRNIREPVLFEQAVSSLVDAGMNIFIDIAPHAILRNYVRDIMEGKGVQGCTIPTVVRGNDDPVRVQRAAAQALIAGVTLAKKLLFPEPGRFVQLPHYPWQRERYWHPVTPESSHYLDRRRVHPLLGYRLAQQNKNWENQLDTILHPMLADHGVGEATVFPATGFLEMVLAAALELKPDTCVVIEQLEIKTAMLLEHEKTRLVRFSYSEDDGRSTITGRELLSKQPWTVHGTARIVPSAGPVVQHGVQLVVPDRAPDFLRHEHLLLTSQAGLQYGPAFQGICHGWVDGRRAVALLDVPALVLDECESYHVHPALLDTALQVVFQIVQSEQPIQQGISYLPVMVERVWFQPGLSIPCYAEAVLTGCNPHSLVADCMLYDADGALIILLTQVRFRRARLQKQAMDKICYPRYQCIPKPLQGDVAYSEIVKMQVGNAIRSLSEHAATEPSLLALVHELDPLLENLCILFMHEALQPMTQDDGSLSLSFLQQVSDRESGFEGLLDWACTIGIIERTDSGLVCKAGQSDAISARQLWCGLIHQYPEQHRLIHQTGRAGLRLACMLTSQAFVAAEHLSAVTLADLLQQVLTAGARSLVSEHLQHILVELKNGLPEGGRLVVLEASEAGPYWLEPMNRATDCTFSDYHCIAASSAGLDAAYQWREQYPAIRVHSGIDAQEDLPLNVQLAMITADFSSADLAEQALAAVLSTLEPGGSLVLLGLYPFSWTEFLGADGGNWHPSALWYQDILVQLGVAAVLMQDLSPVKNTGLWTITAQKPAILAEADAATVHLHQKVLLVQDRSNASVALADQLAGRLTAVGTHVIRLETGVLESIQSVLPADNSLSAVLYLAGIADQIIVQDAEGALADQVVRSTAASQLALKLEQMQISVPIWLITTGAAADVDGWPAIAEGLLSISDSLFWAFGRTMMNEYSTLDLRLICLEDASTDAGMTALIRELAGNDGEQEVLISDSGVRYVPRLVPGEAPGTAANISQKVSDTSLIRLGFDLPGHLRNLQWEQSPRTVPIEDQVEIEVKAAGLNFRDIMYTLGFISDEALENGFAGATLGLECAGVVTATGPDVTDFTIGDRVAAFGPACFATHALTRSAAVSHLPAGLDFSAAATIPAAFFTAWYALCHSGRLQSGEKVLIHGAAGGVGLAAIQIVQFCGAEVYATAGSDEKRDFLRLLGINHIYDSRSLAFADQILHDTQGNGVDLVLNSLAGEAINSNLRVLKPFGRFLELGKRDFYENTRISLRPFRNNISYFGIDADQVMQYQPALTRQIFAKIMALFEQEKLHPLPYTAFEADQIVDAFRYMQQSRQIGKVVVTSFTGVKQIQSPVVAFRPSLAISADATWLVTGGMDGFGLRTAQWLVSKGCRNLVLISRSGLATAEARQAVDELQQQGVHVYAAACDVTDKQALAGLFADIRQTLPPLRGIVHAATVLDDGLLRTMQPEQLHAVLAPKVLGAQYLHELTQDLQLNYFVLFSSATTLFGNPGQGNYVAANGWLEGLGRMRRAGGQPATVVRWGAIDDVGFLARNQKIKESLQGRMGGSALQSETALAVLEQMLLADSSGFGVLELDWAALRRFLPSAGHARFSDFSYRFGSSGSDADPGLSKVALAELPDEELQQVVADLLKQEVGQILRMQPDRIAVDRSLYEMGLDSLMGVELVTALETRFGLQLPVMALSDSPTIAKLTLRVVSHIRGTEQVDTTDAVSQQVAHLARQHATELTEEDLNGIASGLTSGTTDRMIH